MLKYTVPFISTFVLLLGSASPPSSTGPASDLTTPYADFGLDLLRQLSAGQAKDNVFISPYSVAVSLAMLSNGANGATREAILKTIHSPGQSLQTFNVANRTLIEQIQKTTAVQLSVANGLWLKKSADINPIFSGTLHTSYGAEVQNLSFGDPSAAGTINGWVAKHTNGRIPKIIDQTSPATIAILTNAIAFKGKWSLRFDAASTRPHDFRAPAGVRKVPMMTHSASYSHAKDNSLESIRLPYADGSFAMYVVLPQNANAMLSFLQQLTAKRFAAHVASLVEEPGTIELPRFHLSYGTSLNDPLKKLGMGIAFGKDADFSNIPKQPVPVPISDVKHISFLQVDEEGTEAAAATAIIMPTMALRRPTPPPFHMVVDHPFFLAIRDERSGQILFMGVIVEPQS